MAGWIFFILGTMIRSHGLLMLIYNLDLCQIWVIMVTFSYMLCFWYDSSEKNGLILFIFGTVIRYYVLLMHVNYHLALCQIWVILAFMFVAISQKRMGYLFHIWYSNQPLEGLDACTLYRGSVPKCIIYVHYFMFVVIYPRWISRFS